MNLDALSVSLQHKSEYEDTESVVILWPLIEKALTEVGADDITIDAAKNALRSSDGGATLANYLQAEGNLIKQMDFSFRGPLLCYVADLSKDDDGCDIVYDPTQSTVYIETDDALFAFPVLKHYRINWRGLADEVTHDYDPVIDEEWGLDRLLKYADVEVESYKRRDDDL